MKRSLIGVLLCTVFTFGAQPAVPVNAAAYVKTTAVTAENKTFADKDTAVSNTNGTTAVTITMPVNGTLIVEFGPASGFGSTTASLTNINGTSLSCSASADSFEGILRGYKLRKGTYRLSVSSPARFSAYCYSSDNGSISASTRKMIAGKDGYNYQTFTISRRSQFVTSLTSSLNNVLNQTIQKRNSSGTYSTMTDTIKSPANGSQKFFALSAGTYRISFYTKKTDIISLGCGVKAYTGSYATKKSKAKEIKKNKSKTNVLTASDASGKTHYYKVKITSKKKTPWLVLKSYSHTGKIRFTVYGKKCNKSYTYQYGGVKSNILKKYSKGTYYIKVKKMTKKTSGTYFVQFKQ